MCKVKWLMDDGVKISRGTKDSVGIDIHVPRDTLVRPGLNKIGLGIKTQIEPGFFALTSLEKSSVAANDMECLAGVIDADYRGEWVLLIANNSDQDKMFYKGSKICQAIFLPVVQIESEFVYDEKELNKTERYGGFGSTNRHSE